MENGEAFHKIKTYLQKKMMYNGQIIVSILVIDSELTTFSLILSVFPLVDTPLRSGFNTRNPPRVVGINTR